MDLETAQTTTTAKLPILKQGEYDMWRLRIEQYFQVQDYALWDVIENGNSFKPAAQTTTNADGTSTSLIPGPVTTKEKVQKKNDVKARSIFGGNEATKKTQKTLLKQMYENFGASSTESLNSIFNRLQKIVSQLAILGENISQEYLNLKFLRTLPSEWNTYVMVWRNKHDLDTMRFDDLYNNFKIVEQEVKRTTSSSSQNMAFMSPPSSTNEVNTAYGVSTANTQVSPASTQVSTASTQVSTANLSDATVYAFLANQPNGSQLVHEDLEQIYEDDLEEMDLKWQLALLSMRTRRFFQKTSRKITINGSDTAGYDKSKVECFNCHKMGHFARECRGPRNQDSKNRNQDSSRRTVNVEETSSKAMVAIDGAGFDWSYMADDEVPTNMALMAFSDSEELVSDDKLEKKNVFPTVAKIEFVRPKQQEKPVRKPVKYAKMYRPNSTVVNAVRENQVNDVKASTYWVWRPTKLNSASITLKRHNYGHSQKEDQGYVESGCSRHRTWNMSYLSDFKEFYGGYVNFGGRAKGRKITSKGTLKTVILSFLGSSLQNIILHHLVMVHHLGALVKNTDCCDEVFAYSLVILGLLPSSPLPYCYTQLLGLGYYRIVFFEVIVGCIPIRTFKVDLCLITFNPELQVSHTIPDHQGSYPHVDCCVKTSLVCLG
ncbi:ribonuclease H-like domain-containing protein [Tanacetum coccineum]